MAEPSASIDLSHPSGCGSCSSSVRFGSLAAGNLRAVFFLEQAPFTEAIRLHPAEAAARLFTRTFPPIWNREATTLVVNACGDVAERVPAFLLRFRKDRGVIDVARRAAE